MQDVFKSYLHGLCIGLGQGFKVVKKIMVKKTEYPNHKQLFFLWLYRNGEVQVVRSGFC
jgi:hypothetical protein